MAPKHQQRPEPWSREDIYVYPYVECRALGHSWDFVGPNATRRKRAVPFGESVTLRCMRCDMERWDIVTRETRELLARHYDQPPDYKFQPGHGLRRIDFMLMSIDEARRKKVTKSTSITSTVAKKSGAAPATKKVRPQ